MKKLLAILLLCSIGAHAQTFRPVQYSTNAMGFSPTNLLSTNITAGEGIGYAKGAYGKLTLFRTNMASVTLTAGNITTTTDGTVWNDSAQKGIAAYTAGMTNHLVGKIFAATASAFATNFTGTTNLMPAGVGQTNLPANFFVAGKTVRLDLRGRLWTGATMPTWTILVKLGSTTIATATLAAAELSGGYVSSPFRMEHAITCRSTGVSGSVYGEGEIRARSDSIGQLGDNSTYTWLWSGNATVDTTAAQTITVTASPDNNIAANSIGIHVATIEVLP